MESYRVEDGAIHEHRTYYDRLEFLNQLGLADEATQQ
jgi:hypothetical protein